MSRSHPLDSYHETRERIEFGLIICKDLLNVCQSYVCATFYTILSNISDSDSTPMVRDSASDPPSLLYIYNQFNS